MDQFRGPSLESQNKLLNWRSGYAASVVDKVKEPSTAAAGADDQGDDEDD